MSPFEIRLELLKMSKELLEQEFHTAREEQRCRWEALAENARRLGQDLPEYPANQTTFPDENAIVAKAAALNGFVSNTLTEATQPVKGKKS